MKKFTTIYDFYKSLSQKNKKLLDDFIKKDYVSGVRTGYGKKKNFFEEHNSIEGIKIIREILKFKRLEIKIIKSDLKLRNK